MPRFWLQSPRIALFLVLVVSAGMVYYYVGLFLPYAQQLRIAKDLDGGYSFGNDFYPIWLTTRESLLHHSDPYAPETTRAIQTGLFGRPLDAKNPGDPPVNCRAFAYPAYTDIIFWPLAVFSFAKVRVGLAVALALLTAASSLLWLRTLRYRGSTLFLAVLVMFTLSSYAVMEGLFAAQPGLLVAFLMAACFAALVKDRFFLAGSLFAFVLIKPQVAALVLLYLLVWTFSDWRKRRGFVAGLFACSGLFGAASLIVWPHWMARWLHVVLTYGNYTPPPLITYSMGPKLGPLVTAALFMVALIVMWRLRQVPATSSLFLLNISLLLALSSIMLLPGQAVYDHIVLLPGILVMATSWRRLASSKFFAVFLAGGALALFWQWVAVLPLLVFRYFSAQLFGRSLLMLPLDAASFVPLAVSAVLAYAMAQALRRESLEPVNLTRPVPNLFHAPVTK